MLPSCPTTVTKETVLRNIDELRDLVSKSYGQNLPDVNSHLLSSIALFRAESVSEQFTVKKRPAPNTNSVTQESFFSTKKRRTGNAKHIRKPTSEEQASIKSKLDSTENTCANCFKSDDDYQQETDVEWIECIECSSWAHQACAKQAFLTSSLDLIKGAIIVKESVLDSHLA